jgi:two-component system LytT family response regulator
LKLLSQSTDVFQLVIFDSGPNPACLINCLIIEDDPIYRDIIFGYARKISSLNVIATCSNALEANDHLQGNNIKLMFSDIEIGDLSGLDFVRTLQKPPFIIFITSYPDYAVQGFHVDAVDYLVKPVTFERFLKAVNRAADRIKTGDQSTQPEVDHFFVRVDNQHLKLRFDDVIFIEADGDFVRINTLNATHMVLVNLKNIEEQLPSSLFIRTHRSYVVNLSKIETLDNTEIKTTKGNIPLGKNFYENVYASVVDRKLVKRFGATENS